MKTICLLGVLFSAIPIAAFAKTKAPETPLLQIRQKIEKKEVRAAVDQLLLVYSKELKTSNDVQKIAHWLSLFLYDETVAAYEKALTFSEAKDPSAEIEFKKALESEPFNKVLLQTFISYLIDQKKTSQALEQIAVAEKNHPYFKIFSVYRRYLSKPVQWPANRDLKLCDSIFLIGEERDFCQAVLVREAAQLKGSISKKQIAEIKTNSYPDILFFVWEMTSNTDYLKQYLSRCKNLSEKQKRKATAFPGLCEKVTNVETLLQPSESAE